MMRPVDGMTRLTLGAGRLGHIGLRVTRLIRVGYGPFELGDLKVSLVKEVESIAIKRLLPTYGGSGEKKK